MQAGANMQALQIKQKSLQKQTAQCNIGQLIDADAQCNGDQKVEADDVCRPNLLNSDVDEVSDMFTEGGSEFNNGSDFLRRFFFLL